MAGSAGSGAAPVVPAPVAPSPMAMPMPGEGAGDAARPSPGCGMMGLNVSADENATMMHDGAMREYIVHYPKNYDPQKPIPFLFNLHGYTSTNTSQRMYTNMNAKADAVGFIVVYPQGLDNSFNAGDCCGNSSMNDVDDVGFMRAILEKVGGQACVDLRRVYSTGMSNGGMMSFRLACDASDIIAAVAPVVGFVADSSCMPTRGVPILSFLGTDDGIVGYDRANPQSEMWAMRNECKSGPMMEAHGGSNCKIWKDCRDGVEVHVCSMMGMGHCWPGPPCSLGTANTDIIATDAMWDFFARYRLP